MSEPHSKEYYLAKAERIDPITSAFIGGEYVPAATGVTFDDISPIDGRVIAKVVSCGQEDADRAVNVARKAFSDGIWRDLSPSKRGEILGRFADLIEENKEYLGLLETLDMGKPISEAVNGDIPGAAKSIRWYGQAIDKVYGEVAPVGGRALCTMTREPVGVVAAIVPWNFPLVMASWKIGPALAAGNSVILKPAEQSPLSAIHLGKLAKEAGIPDGVFNVLPGLGENVGQALGLHNDVDCIAFTGSTQIGKLMMKYAGESNLKRVSVECGGKSPLIVMADAPDLDAAAAEAAWGVFYNQGQVCNASTRLLVEASIKDAFVAKVAEVAKTIKVGHPLDPNSTIGAIVDENQFKSVCSFIEKGKSEGANVVLGGRTLDTEKGGFYLEPTIFSDVKNDMTIAQKEIFGPVLSVISFETEEEAIEIANDTIYGLGAGVFTKDINRAMRMSRALNAGCVWVNTYDAGDMSATFGGYKQSGFGRDKSLHALDKYTEIKNTWIATP